MMRCFVLTALIVPLLWACSVKEDRSDCPCKLCLDFSEIDTNVVKSVYILATSEEGAVLSDLVEASDMKAMYVRDVPHGTIRVNAWSVDENRIDNIRGVVIPFGCECPPIYMHSFEADTRGESCYETIRLCKNHCRLTIKVEGADEIPYSLTFKGNVNGYDLEGLPSDGEFSCVAYPGDIGESQTLLPRQTDTSLQMAVDDGTSVSKTFAVGEYFQKCGYDWNAENLEDVTIILDYYLTYITISIKEWDKEYIYDVIL